MKKGFGMQKRLIWILVGTAVLQAALFAGGKKDITEQQAESLESWQETFDISGKKSGKYNIVVTAEDKGGNVQTAGPFNITIDPASDLPVAGITNPVSEMRVSGNLNIVGTCVDDDAVDHIMLILDGDTEHPVRAAGADFWSYYLETAALADGAHTVLAYGVDVNGVEGNPVSVTWHLDRRQPVTVVENYGQGPLVSGKVTLTGRVSDGNGIKSFAYSTDGGSSFVPVKLSENKKTGECTFSVPVDTVKMNDGAAVVWFRAEDKQGSENLSSFLFFVDNTKPDVRILYPLPGEPVNGIFAAAGSASDTIGIQSLTWEFDGKTGSFDLIAGNPYWTCEFDVRGYTKKSAELVVTAKDTAGNTTVKKTSVSIDNRLDRPVVNVSYPEPGSVVSGAADSLFIRGAAYDDDGVAGVYYRVDGGAEWNVPSDGAFYADFSAMLESRTALPAGKHSVSVYAVDVHGVKGEPQVIPFVSQGAEPAFSAPVVAFGKAETQPYSFGMEIHPEAAAVFKTAVSAECGIAAAQWTVNGEAAGSAALKTPAKSVPIEIPLNSDLPWGVVRLSATAEDAYGRTVSREWLVYVTNLSKLPPLPAEFAADVPDTAAVSETVSAAAVRFDSVSGEPYSTGMAVELPAAVSKSSGKVLCVSVSSAEPVSSVIYTIAAAALTGSAGSSAVYGGTGTQTGRAALRKTADPTVFEADVPLQNLPAGWHSITVSAAGKTGTLASAAALVGVVRSKDASAVQDDGEMYWSRVQDDRVSGFFNITPPFTAYLEESPRAAAPHVSVETDGKTVTVTADGDGSYKNILIRADDASGTAHLAPPIDIEPNAEAPLLALETPENGAWVRQELSVRGTASDAHGIRSVEISLDGGAFWQPAEIQLADSGTQVGTQPADSGTQPAGSGTQPGSAGFSAVVPLAALPDGLISLDVRVTDSLGRTAIVRRAVCKDTEAPAVRVITPAFGDVVNGETRMVFQVTDNGRTVSAQYVPPLTETDPAVSALPLELTALPSVFTGTAAAPLGDTMAFEFTDAAGNVQKISLWEFEIDAVSDMPRTEIHLPQEGAVLTSDFVVSGVIYDDDGESRISYKIDDGEYVHPETYGTSFAINVPIGPLGDNEHTVSIYAEDIHGVRGEEVTRTFRISLAEPQGAVTSPLLSETVNGSVKLTGMASDANGIAGVQISVDNGNSFNDVSGTENWEYEFDTRVIQDGTHVVFLRVFDSYGISALYTSLVNIDNTAPELSLELPADDSSTSGMLFFSGQTTDNIKLEKLYITIRPLGENAAPLPPHLAYIDLVPDNIISHAVDISALPDGFYNIELTGADAGGNTRRISRNIKLDKNYQATKVDVLYPLNGEHVQGVFNVYGTAVSESPVEKLLLYVDDAFAGETTLSATGYFKFELTPELVTAGVHSLSVRALSASTLLVESNAQRISYEPSGPWISIDNFTMCDFAVDRPYLEGRAGYVFTEQDLLLARAKDSAKSEKRKIADKSVAKVELSFDNGKTFTVVGTGGLWRYRIENEDMREGYHFLLARATMKNGETAVTRSIIRIDKTRPSIKLISPGAGGSFNDELVFSGLASDDVALKSVTFALRSGDKSAYEVPAFIQGLYFDWHFWGATLYDVGVGLTFFDDNVKLQAQFGQFTQLQRELFDKSGNDMRYGGNVFGVKLLANVAYVPFRYFFGPSWDWLSAGFAVGANFSMFTETQSAKPQILSAVLAQIEFPRVTLQNQKMFRTFSLYTEMQVWFLPTDVQTGGADISSIIPQISGGVRVNVF